MSEYRRVVVLTVDALKATHLPMHGYDQDTAPFLASLAEETPYFRRCYSMSSHTRESMPAMLTGRYPEEVLGDNYRLNVPTAAESLSVESAMFHSNPFLSRAYGFDAGFDTFDDDLWMGRNRLLTLAKRLFDKFRNQHYVRAEEINNRSLSWLDGLDSDDFFLWNHYMDVHGPYQPPMAYREAVDRGDVSNRESQLLLQKSIRRPESISEEEQQILVDLYDAEIRYLDDQLRAFVSALGERSLLEDTLILITADHGEALGEDGFYEHPRELTDGLTHVPLLLVAENLEAESSENLVGSLDIVPTILDAFGREVEDTTLSGTSLFTVLEDPKPNQTISSQVTKKQGGTCEFLVRGRGSEARLTVTPGERPSVEADGPAARALAERISQWSGDSMSLEPAGDDREIRRRLDALGYLDDE